MLDRRTSLNISLKRNPEHVPHFALVPIGGRPDRSDAGQREAALRKRYFDTHIFVAFEREEMINDREIVAGWPTRCTRIRSSMADRSYSIL